LNNIRNGEKMKKEKQIEVLKETIKWFKKQIKPRDCGWMHTTVDGLKFRIQELRKEKK
tara:strand:+ start:497 stop:670 length:174 start_codon:yes stop_codon:yes gene_type:complete